MFSVMFPSFALSKLLPLIDHGHRHFGENKVQEAEVKWSEIKKNKKSCIIF